MFMLEQILRDSWVTVVFMFYFHYALYIKPLPELIVYIFKAWLRFMAFHLAYHYLDIHKRFGVWGVSEPKSHLRFTIKSSWIIIIFMIGDNARQYFFGVLADNVAKGNDRIVMWELPDEYKFIPMPTSTFGVVMWGVLGFYLVDFLRYWAHRLGHDYFLYVTFPFAHAHHHNQMFMNPMVWQISPMCHLASIATWIPPVLLGCNGLHKSSIVVLVICFFPNNHQHFGFDPLPWLTRINHYYFYGALPWIPLYHAYHHNPFIKDGNFGNTTVLFDYVFGTLQPESVYHIENGKPMSKIVERLEDAEKLDRIFESMFHAGDSKNRMDLHENNEYNVVAAFDNLVSYLKSFRLV